MREYSDKIAFFLFIPFVFLLSCNHDLPTKPSGNIIYVGKSHSGPQQGTRENPYLTIASGVSAAKEGASIIVLPGDYIEKDIKLKKGQKVFSEEPNAAIVTNAADYYDLFVLYNCDQCEIRNFKIIWNIGGKGFKYPISCESSDSINISNNQFEGEGFYVSLCNGSIKGNKINGCSGIYALPITGKGDLLVENNDIYISSICYYIGFGMSFGGDTNSARMIVRNNTVSGISGGIDISSSSNVILENNTVINNQLWGIKIEGQWTYPWSMIDLGGGAGVCLSQLH